MNTERYVAAAAALLLVLSAVLVIRRAWHRYLTPIEPLSLFLIVWALVLGLFAIPWVRYTRSSLSAWFAIYGSIATFSAGAVVAYRMTSRRSEHQFSPAEGSDLDNGRLRVACFACLVLLAIGFAAFLHAVNDVIGWTSVFTAPSAVRTLETSSQQFQTSYGAWKLFTYFGALGFLIWTIAARKGAFGGRRHWALWILGPFYIVPYLFTADRTLLLTTLLWATLFHMLWRPIGRIRHFVAGAAVVAVVMVVVFLGLAARVGKTIQHHPEISGALTTRTLDQFALPYVYLTSEAPAMTKLIADPNRPTTYGAMTFRPLVKLASEARLAGTPPALIAPYYPIPFQTFNLFSWVGPFYLDYGMAGCLIIPFLLGLGVASASRYALARRSFGGTWMLSVLTLATAAAPIADKFSDTITWEIAAVGAVLALVLSPAAHPLQDSGRRAAGLITRIRQRDRMSWAGAVVAAILVGVVSTAVAGTPSRAADAGSQKSIRATLLAAAARAHREFLHEGSVDSAALVSQLQLSDPGVNWQEMLAVGEVPAGGGGVAVVTAPKWEAFAARTAKGEVLEVIREERGRYAGTYGPFIAPQGGAVSNPTFAPQLQSWSFSRGTVASATNVSHRLDLGDARLEVRGTGRSGRATTVYQVIPASAIASIRAGKVVSVSSTDRSLNLTLRYQTRRLTRRLAVKLRLDYVDGTRQFFAAIPRGPSAAATGLPEGTSSGWRSLVVSAVPRRPYTDAILYAVDTGRRSFRGDVLVTGANLR